jgi:hypothetical protein
MGAPEQEPYGEAEEVRVVRPYTITRGRTRSGDAVLALEALVRGVAGAAEQPGQTPERQRILALVSAGILSVAEISAHLGLPLGVVRVLVTDLAADRLVAVHAPTPSASQPPAANLKVLESVLNGISSL